MVQPIGAFTVNAVTPNALLAGLAIVKATLWETPPFNGFPLVTAMVGGLLFAECAGLASVIRERNPERRSRARIVADLSPFFER